MVTADQRQIITEVAEQLGNSFGSCQAQGVPAKYVPQLLTAEWQEHCLYVDSDLLQCTKDDKSIKILLLEIKKKGNAYCFFNQQSKYCAPSRKSRPNFTLAFLCINAKFLPQCSSP